MKIKSVWMLSSKSSYQEVNCLTKIFFLFPTSVPTPKRHLILPHHHSCWFSWTHFCQIIVTYSLKKNAVISQACTGLVFILYKQAWSIWFFFLTLKGLVFFGCYYKTTCLWSSESSHIYYSTRNAFLLLSFAHQIWSSVCPSPGLKLVA